MLSNFMIVGRVAEEPEVNMEEDLDEVRITLLVRNPFPDDSGFEPEECVDISLWRGMADECRDVLKKGNIIAVKGRICGTPRSEQEEEHTPLLIGEKVSYI